MILEVIGYKGVVGNATYQWLKAMLPDMVVTGRDKGDDIPRGVDDDTISFVCVPEVVVPAVVDQIYEYASLIVIRSTVKPGTCRQLQAEYETHICHVPEFLKEATAVYDEFNQPNVIIGYCCDEHAELLAQIYNHAHVPLYMTSTVESELTKLALNSYLACLISFWNEVELIANKSGTTGHRIGALTALDSRVSHYGAKYHNKFGGKCLPKDLKQMIEYAEYLDIDPKLLKAIEERNDETCLRGFTMDKSVKGISPSH